MKKYAVTVPKLVHWATDVDPRVTWCNENIARPSLWECTGWAPKTFSFRREQDAVMFALKWVGYEG